MIALKNRPTVRSEVVSDPSIMSGDPAVRGTRVPAMTIVAYLGAGRTDRKIFADYPSLPVDGIEAVIVWAERELGRGWRETSAAARNRP